MRIDGHGIEAAMWAAQGPPAPSVHAHTRVPDRHVERTERDSACRRPCDRDDVYLRYDEYLERENLRAPWATPFDAAVRRDAGRAPAGPSEDRGVSADRPSYAGPRLGDVPRSAAPIVRPVVERVERREVMTPLSNVIDVFA